MRFHDAIYFGLVTLTTEGYGDVTPKVWISRYIIIFTVLAFLFIIKPIHTKLGVLLEITKYSKMTYRKNSSKSKHILILGECGIESYLAFLEELYIIHCSFFFFFIIYLWVFLSILLGRNRKKRYWYWWKFYFWYTDKASAWV